MPTKEHSLRRKRKSLDDPTQRFVYGLWTTLNPENRIIEYTISVARSDQFFYSKMHKTTTKIFMGIMFQLTSQLGSFLSAEITTREIRQQPELWKVFWLPKQT